MNQERLAKISKYVDSIYIPPIDTKPIYKKWEELDVYTYVDDIGSLQEGVSIKYVPLDNSKVSTGILVKNETVDSKYILTLKSLKYNTIWKILASKYYVFQLRQRRKVTEENIKS